MKSKRWSVCPPNSKLQTELSQALNIHPVVAQLLINRGIVKCDEARIFLSPDATSLHDPFLLKDMDKAVARIQLARERGETVLIFGDYDVDGVTSSALLRALLDSLGVAAVNYIPHRMDEGYGLNTGVVQVARSAGASLIISVDCGINAFFEVEAINAAGLEIIIIDHHQPDDIGIPPAYAVIDPKRPDCRSPFKHFAAVGLVAKLMQAVLGEIPREHWDIIAIGTIADVVSLHGENRIFAKLGLPLISETKKHGLQALLEVAKIKGKQFKSFHVGFVLGPRINAAGRMDSATASLDLLLSNCPDESLALAKSIETQNVARQRLQRQVVDEAMTMIEAQIKEEDAQVLIVHKEGWHKGVLGIVASRIMDKYSKPAIVISFEEGVGTGSARSVEGFHLHEALTSCAGILENFGGHKRAAGLTLRHENIAQFCESINRFAKDMIQPQDLLPLLSIDAEIPLSCLDLDLVNLVSSLEPHGEGNPMPLFCTRRLTVKSRPQVLGRETLKFWVTDGEHTFSAVGFGMGEYKDMVDYGAEVDLAYSLSIDDWNKAPTVQLTVKDIKPSGDYATRD